jgi:long-chain acyl-CoA synthetase
MDGAMFRATDASAGEGDYQYFREVVAQAATREDSLFEQLALTARDRWDRTAITDGRAELKYGQLITLSSEFCRQLAEVGLKQGDAIGVALKNSKEFLIAAFGCWKLGAALVPVNPELNETEVGKYVDDIGIRAFVTNEKDGHSVRSSEVTRKIRHLWLCPSTDEGWAYTPCPAFGDERRDSIGGPRAWPSTISYSTGSTGKPKRITRSQAHFVGEQEALSARLRISPDDRILAIAPFFHGYGLMYSALVPLLSGGVVVTVPSFLPAEAAAVVERERITGVSAVPFMFGLMASQRERRDFSCLRYALSGGAPLTEEVASSFYEKFGVPLRQAYGSTETGAISIADGGGAASVGRAAPGVLVQVVDDSGESLPVGAEGYVQVRSPFAASAYDNDPGSCESRFVNEAFFSGDLGCLGADGELTLSRRKRGFLNVGGLKVDPAEVENVLLELPAVSEAVVLGIADGAATERIHAVLVSRADVSQEDVRRHCAMRLSSFKQPKVIEFRDALPRSPLGKVVRQQLIEEIAARGRSGRVLT